MNVNLSDGESSMSKGGKQSSDIFDIDRLRMIVELMEEHELSEVDLQQGDEKIKLNRGSAAPVYMPSAAAPASAPVAAPAAAAAATPAASANTITIDAPMIGTFYSRANPESEPFVKVGQRVTEDTIVCIVEAMKVFNEIPAECSGTVVEILVNDQQPVDFGKPMFRIDPNA
ncbi:Acetyl-CoA biotin carboxyl carrier [Rhodopirellula maiorica SM1]|uniref:Biotin carboxyl carrier protein of acetyl-CoA carboxylase n=1 Tax=Rhodopirellula maiorica SM1 TaxID=1265738 RepID=M5S3H2_9BACT|nr:acetyl-CoA carboxylase biotin carboxyl carrier protein [Rhodopirellula maiorica]EMI20729.1 Acetyl-CoA biotin carboxyl carrier [Rhodopirellula maiorica SM1]